MKLIDLTGQTFERLTVIRRGPDHVTPSGSMSVRWHCLCTCGERTLVRGDYLKSGKTRSCGCLQRELVAERLRLQSLGRPGVRSPSWKGDGVGYAGAHYRVRTQKGAAEDHPCADCGAPAREWSYVGGCPRERVTDGTESMPPGLRYSPDPDRYLPRCKSCHTYHDNAARRAA